MDLNVLTFFNIAIMVFSAAGFAVTNMMNRG